MKHFVKNIYIHIIKMEKISPLVDSHVLAHHVFIDMPRIPVERCIFHKGLDSMFILPLFNKTALKAVVSLHILLCDHKMFASKSQTEHVVRMDLLYSYLKNKKKQRDRPLISIRRWGFTLQKRLDRGAS